MSSVKLHNCVMEGDLEGVRHLVEEGKANIEFKINIVKKTPLILGVLMNNLPIVKYLVQNARANINAVDDEYGQTPFLWAAKNGNLEITRFLVEEKADVNAIDNEGMNALLRAIQYHNGLYYHKNDDTGNIDMVRYLVEDLKADIESRDYQGFSGLLTAAVNGRSHNLLLHYLVKNAKANVNAKTNGPYYSNCYSCSKECYISSSFNEDAIPSMSRSKPSTPFRQIHSKAFPGATSLHIAATEGHLKTVQFLVENKADAESEDDLGCTPLLRAAASKHKEIAQYFIEHTNAKIEAKTWRGITVVQAAASEFGDTSFQNYLSKKLMGTLILKVLERDLPRLSMLHLLIIKASEPEKINKQNRNAWLQSVGYYDRQQPIIHCTCNSKHCLNPMMKTNAGQIMTVRSEWRKVRWKF